MTRANRWPPVRRRRRTDVVDLQRNWEALGQDDPFWAILADPTRRGNRWQPDEFFATGTAHVVGYLGHLESLGLRTGSARALDFGCGAGRMTQALAAHFAVVDGVDVATSMLELARAHNSHPETVRYHHNPRPDLALFADGSFDLVLSIVVLQHMRNDLKERYLAEFVRVLAADGLAVFTVPSRARATPRGLVHRVVPNLALNVYRRRRYGLDGVMELHAMSSAAVNEVVAAAGGEVLARTEEPMAGAPWRSYLYVVRRRPGVSPPPARGAGGTT